MREYKFRGYSKEFERWIYGLPIIENEKAFILDISYFNLDCINWQCKLYEVDKATVGQYTGLHDKNGKEIYEGDIVRIPNDYELYGTNAGEAYEVYFAYGGFRLKPKYNSKARGYWLEDDNEIEIIGNIYESKELLNETNR